MGALLEHSHVEGPSPENRFASQRQSGGRTHTPLCPPDAVWTHDSGCKPATSARHLEARLDTHMIAPGHLVPLHGSRGSARSTEPLAAWWGADTNSVRAQRHPDPPSVEPAGLCRQGSQGVLRGPGWAPAHRPALGHEARAEPLLWESLGPSSLLPSSRKAWGRPRRASDPGSGQMQEPPAAKTASCLRLNSRVSDLGHLHRRTNHATRCRNLARPLQRHHQGAWGSLQGWAHTSRSCRAGGSQETPSGRSCPCCAPTASSPGAAGLGMGLW